MKHLKLYEEKKIVNKEDKEKDEMFSSIYDMYSEYILDNEISQDDILSYVYELVTETPELLNNHLEKN